MFLFVTLWAAVLNLLLLLIALAWTPAFWSGALRWLQTLPWRSLGAELAALLHMQAVAAGAVWALWLCVSVVLLAGAVLAHTQLKLRAVPAPVASPPTPEVSAMFGQLSSSLQELQGFGSSATPPQAPSTPVPVLTVLAKVEQEASPAAIAASLQEIDPELGSSYASLLRELDSPGRKG